MKLGSDEVRTSGRSHKICCKIGAKRTRHAIEEGNKSVKRKQGVNEDDLHVKSTLVIVLMF